MSKGLIVLILTFIIFPSYGQTQQTTTNKIQPYKYFDLFAYKRTLALCSQKNDLQDRAETSEGMLEFVTTGFKSGVSLWSNDVLQVSEPTRVLIHSQGYLAALADCYGSDASAQKWFTAAVIAADAGGHILGFLPWTIGGALVSKLFKASAFARAYPGLVEGGGKLLDGVRKLSVAGLAGYLGWESYQDYKMRKYGYQYLEQYNDRMVDATQEEADETYVIVRQSLNTVNAELAAGVKDPAHKKFLIQKKTELEERLGTWNGAQRNQPQ